MYIHMGHFFCFVLRFTEFEICPHLFPLILINYGQTGSRIDSDHTWINLDHLLLTLNTSFITLDCIWTMLVQAGGPLPTKEQTKSLHNIYIYIALDNLL